MRFQEIDAALRRLAKQRAGLDAEEARWLRVADAQDAWRDFGFVHAFEYLEAVFGYSPRTATERLRVARELGEMPALDAALRTGDVSYSVVREISRVATPTTIDQWLDAARGKNLREIEQLVAGRKKGDLPEDRPDLKLVSHRVVLDLDGESFAIWRQLRAALDEEMGERLDDKQLIVALGARCVSGNDEAGDDVDAANDNAAPSQVIHISTCTDCKRAWQVGAGVRVEIAASVLERAECDALICDDDHGARAKHAIPPVTKRKVFDRDEYRCRVPGCRSARNLDVHHIVHREDGGTNELSNLVLLCRGHHKLHHDGVIEISGRAPDDLLVKRRTPLGRPAMPAVDDEPRAPVTMEALARVIEKALADEEARQSA